MRPSELLAALHTAEKLKDTTRHCYTSGGRHESVAEHSWRIALMAFFLRDEFPKADMDKVTRMCLIHDLGECFTGDIPAFDKTAQDESTEEALLYQWVASLPSPCREEMRALYDEMAALETQEAQILQGARQARGRDLPQRVRHFDLGGPRIRPPAHLWRAERRLFALPDGASSGCPAGIARQDRTRG